MDVTQPENANPVESPSKTDASDASSGGFGGGLRVSLMPSSDRGKGLADPRQAAIVMVLVIVVETLLIGGGYFFLIRKEAAQKRERAAIVQEIIKVKESIDEAAPSIADMIAFGRQVSAANVVLDDHLYWTRTFAFLEEITKPTVTYKNFTGDSTSGTITMDAIGESYRDVAEQLVLFREHPQVLAVLTGAASANVNAVGEVDGVNFSLTVTLAQDVWDKTDFTELAPSAASASSRDGSSIQIITPEEELESVPQSVSPDTRNPVDPGAEGGATAPVDIFDDGESN